MQYTKKHYICHMKHSVNTLRTSQPTVATKTVVKNYGNGQIAELTNVPIFNGPRVHLSGANKPEFWAQHPNNGYQTQMEMASKKLYDQCAKNPKLCRTYNLSSSDLNSLSSGKAPEGRTWHHDHSPKNDCIMVLVDKVEHKANPHAGGSLTSNNDLMKDRIPLPDSKVEAIENALDYSMHKHKTVTSLAAGIAVTGTTATLYHWGCKKLGRKASGWGYVTCIALGSIVSVAVHHSLNDGKTYL